MMMASPVRKVGVLKCYMCRVSRQKCVPIDPGSTERIWVEGGQQEKCFRCAKIGHDCGPPEYAAPNDDGELRSPSISLGKRRASDVALLRAQSGDMPPIYSGLNMAGPSRQSGDDEQALQCRLREIDLRQDALSKLDEDILSIDVLQGDYENGTRSDALYQTRNAVFHTFLGMLHLAKDLANRVENAGNATVAFNAYTRILEGYRTLELPAYYEVRTVLIRMAKLLWAFGDDYRAQRLAWQALESRDPIHQAQLSDLDILKEIARSLLRTYPELSRLIQPNVRSQSSYNCNSLLPPLLAMVESSYASQVPGNVLQSGFHPAIDNKLPIESPIVGGLDAILELLREFTDAHLEARDSNKDSQQSLLHLAASRCKEALGQAVILRAKCDTRLKNRLVNARDRSGQTVLTAAILNGCSLIFITTLLDNDAELDPSTVQRAMTPLQAACFVGSLDIVDLLLTRGADAKLAFPGSRAPYEIAQDEAHFDIVDRLSRHLERSQTFQTVSDSGQGG